MFVFFGLLLTCELSGTLVSLKFLPESLRNSPVEVWSWSWWHFCPFWSEDVVKRRRQWQWGHQEAEGTSGGPTANWRSFWGAGSRGSDDWRRSGGSCCRQRRRYLRRRPTKYKNRNLHLKVILQPYSCIPNAKVKLCN